MSDIAPPPRNGPGDRLPDEFSLTKPRGNRVLTAVCELWTHPFGWELRLMVDGEGLRASSVVRSAQEIRTTADMWRSSLLEKGWS